MLVVSWLEVSIAFAFVIKSFFGEHSTHYSQAWILEPRYLPKERKKVKFPYNTMKGGRLTISLTRMLCLFVSKFSDMLSNRNWTYVEVTTIWGRAIEILMLMHVRDMVLWTILLKHTTLKRKLQEGEPNLIHTYVDFAIN